jgi:hypothetical protein
MSDCKPTSNTRSKDQRSNADETAVSAASSTTVRCRDPRGERVCTETRLCGKRATLPSSRRHRITLRAARCAAIPAARRTICTAVVESRSGPSVHPLKIVRSFLRDLPTTAGTALATRRGHAPLSRGR